MADQLIHTKLRLPFTRPGLVSRPRLHESVILGLYGPLTLITAPAGYGKTTLAASCVADCGIPTAWLSLDKDDNHPERFMSYLLAALQGIRGQTGREAAQLMEASPQAPAASILTSLINDLDTSGREMILVLDDYHFINNPAVHEAVSFLIDHCPKTFHLVIATRSDPPLPIARLRARNQMVELRAADLSFNRQEAAQFLNDVMGLHLDPASISRLKERTEGWIAGLQMAALSMRQREDTAGFIDAFSGTNRYILDYLLEEVLAGQPPEIQRFLLHTSILERLTAPLCDAVLSDDEGSGTEAGNPPTSPGLPSPQGSSSTLEYLDRASLFLVPLDDERIWYRYHHLFADLLRTQLKKDLGVQGVTRLHLRAAAWHEQNDSILEAIQHASLASDDERVERLVEQNYIELVNRGEMSALHYWTGRLSRDMVYSRPKLCIYEAFSRSWFGELDEAERLLEAAEKHIRAEIPAAEVHALLGHLTYIKSRVTGMRGDLPRAIELNLTAREFLPDSNLALRFDLNITLGFLYFLKGDDVHARQYLNETIRNGKAVGAILNTVAAYCLMARLYAVQGRLNRTCELYQQAAQWIHGTGGQHLGASSLIEVGMAEVLCERNDLESALVHLKQGLESIHLWGKADDLVLAQITKVRIHLAQADNSSATESMEKAVQIIRTRGVFPEARHGAEAAQAELWLAQGDIQAANRWAADMQERFGSEDPFRFENEVIHLARARVLIAQNKTDEALDLLSSLEETARSAQRMGRVMEILLLKAIALRGGSDPEPALQVLTHCLELAGPEGFVRIFLDEGQPVRTLLARWLAHAGNNPLCIYASYLLTQFDASARTSSTVQDKVNPTVGLVEPLSRRELEVLHLIALGSTNQEIARQLVVSPGTVKAHTASIYRKLLVANRTEAVKCARDLGILA